LQTSCQIFYKLLVRISLGASDLVMKMSNREHHGKFVTQVQQNAEKRYGIGAAGACHGNPLPRPEQLLVANIFERFFHHPA
jgi:hypothetical protein